MCVSYCSMGCLVFLTIISLIIDIAYISIVIANIVSSRNKIQHMFLNEILLCMRHFVTFLLVFQCVHVTISKYLIKIVCLKNREVWNRSVTYKSTSQLKSHGDMSTVITSRVIGSRRPAQAFIPSPRSITRVIRSTAVRGIGVQESIRAARGMFVGIRSPAQLY